MEMNISGASRAGAVDSELLKPGMKAGHAFAAGVLIFVLAGLFGLLSTTILDGPAVTWKEAGMSSAFFALGYYYRLRRAFRPR
jgi:hypothetical protein